MIRFLLLLAFSGAQVLGQGTEGAFDYAKPGYVLEFPKDHGSHPDFKIEWWYLTGHLFDENRRRFGFESTFFRLAQPNSKPGNVEFDHNQIYMAHMAVSDLAGKVFYHEERFNREGWNAYAKTGDLDVRNGNWSLQRDAKTNVLALQGSVQSKVNFSLHLSPAKEHVIFGENGVSKKGKAPESASYYITWPRLNCGGDLRINGQNYVVTGSAWMDHEISSSQLDVDQTGWDWVSIQFDDGRELMAYMLRLKEGGYSEYSKLVWIDRDGTLTHQQPDQFTWRPDGYWLSKETGANYPISPSFTTTDPSNGKKRTFRVKALMQAQEMSGKLGGIPYWEGACDIVEGDQVVGKAYLELAGYVPGLNERLR